MDNLTNLKEKLLAEQTEDRLLRYIRSKPVKEGEKLPNEFRLGELFGVGRSTVREAVKLLVSKGILEIRRGAGTYVISTATDKEDPLGLRGVEDKMSLALDLADVRMILEPDIAQLAAIHATKEDVVKLRQICQSIEDRIAEGESYIEEDIAFHTCVAECTKNRVMKQLIPIIDTTVMMFVNVTHNQLTDQTLMTHRRIVDAIAEGDFVGAKTAMMMHMAFNRDLIRKNMKNI